MVEKEGVGRRATARRASAQVYPGLAFLLGLSTLLARGCIRAGGHIHEWTPGTPPETTCAAFHPDGAPVTDASPALPGEVVGIRTTSAAADMDRCIASGCPFPNGEAWDDGAWLRLERFHDGVRPGQFVIETAPGRWARDEVPDPTDGKVYGRGVGVSETRFYRIDRKARPRHTVSLLIWVEDSGKVTGPDGRLIAGFDDAPHEIGPMQIPVDGS